MNKKHIISMLAAALALCTVSISAFATETTVDTWKEIENKYYNVSNAKTTVINIKNDDILLGSEILPNTTTKMLRSTNLNSQANINAFISDVVETGLIAATNDNNIYLATVEGSADPIPSTALIHDSVVAQVIEADQRNFYKCDLSDKNKLDLASVLDLSNTTPYFVFLDGFMCGIVFDDGNTQMVKPILSYNNTMDNSNIYSVDELLEILQNNFEELTQYENINKNLDTEKPNVVVG